MKGLFLLIVGVLAGLSAGAQSFTLVSSTTFAATVGGGEFRGLSGMDYVPGRGWYVVSDRGGNKERVNEGHVFLAKEMPPVAEVQRLTTQVVPTSLESIRYDAAHDLFFLAGERDSVAAGEHDSTNVLLINGNKLAASGHPLHWLDQVSEVNNKGIEGLALTPSGAVWLVPEAGWPGETALNGPTVHFRRYKNPYKSTQFELFTYPIDRFPNAFYPADRHGGIAELLALNDTTLFVLERAYHQFLVRNEAKQDVKREVVLGRIYRVAVHETTHTLTKTAAFDFNDPAQFTDVVRNLESMSWGPLGPTGKRRLYLLADDNFEDRPDRQTTQRNQWIVLEEQ